MPITFGSVGDIISVSLIVKELVLALGESQGSAVEYQETIRELLNLDRVFLEIEQLSRIQKQSIELSAFYTTANCIIAACRKCLLNFKERCRKYDASLGEGKKGNIVSGVSRKIQWRLIERQELDRFRSDINAHTSCLSILLATANVTISDTNYKKLEERQAAAEERGEAGLVAQNAILSHIQDRLEENTQLVASISSNATRIASLLRLGWLRRMGFEVKEYLANIMTINMSIYQTVIRIQAAIPYINHGPIAAMFTLEDAIGRVTPVTLQFINSWDAFDSVLETRFRNLPGYRKIVNKEFALQNRATERDISRVRPWEGAILPGQNIDMSMIFTDTRRETRMPCPGCKNPCDDYSDAGTQCINCGMWFRRVIELNDSDDGQLSDLMSQSNINRTSELRKSRNSQTEEAHSRSSTLRKTASGTKVFGPNRPPVMHGEQHPRGNGMHPKEEISCFKRVKIICRQRVVKSHNAGASVFATAKQQGKSENRINLENFREKEKVLGAKHPETILAMIMLAEDYRNQHRFKAAAGLLRGALCRDDGFLQSCPDAIRKVCQVFIAISIDQNTLNQAQDVCQRLLEITRPQADDPDPVKYQHQLQDFFQLKEIQIGSNVKDNPNYPNENEGLSDIDSSSQGGYISLTDSVRNYNYENGRRYHSSRTGEYYLPNDEQEQERLDIQYNAILLLLDGELFLAPIKTPKKILDQGTGTGIWAMDVADAHLTAQVRGTDISPIQPTWIPPNVDFVIDNMDLSWTDDENSFDLIHCCMGNGFVSRDWEHFLSESQKTLLPGGWVEIKDIDFKPLSQDLSLPKHSPIVRWHNLLEEASSLAGNITFRFDAAKLAETLQNPGFTNVTVKTFQIPLGRLQNDPRVKEISMWWRNTLRLSLEPFSAALFTRFLKWPSFEIKQLLDEVLVELSNPSYHWDWQFYVVYGQKPTIGS